MKTMHLEFEDEDFITLKEKANRLKLSTVAFAKKIVLGKGIILKKDYSIIDEHTKKVDEILNELKGTIAIIRETEQCYNPDLDLLIDKMIEVSKTENDLLAEMRQNRKKDDKIFKEEIDKAVAQSLKEIKDGD